MVVPKLRFKEFDDSYKDVNLINVLSELKEKISYKKIENASVGSLGFRRKNDAFKNKSNVLDSHKLKIVYPNNFVIGLGSKQIDFVLNNFNEKFGVSTAYSVFRISGDLSARYLDLLIIKNLKKLSSLYMIVSARQGKSVNKIDLFNHSFFLSSLKEQEKIANFFDLIDKKIDLQNQKLKLLKDYKRGLLLTIFNMSNKLRFKGFNENLNIISLNDITIFRTSKLSKIDANSIGNFALYDINSQIGFVNHFASKNEYITIVKDGSIGKIRILEGFTNFTSTMGMILSSGDNNLRFIYFFMQTINFSIFRKGSIIPHIYYKDYSKVIVKLPSLNEQRKIANFFTLIDKIIIGNHNAVRNFKILKKSLLSKMFI